MMGCEYPSARFRFPGPSMEARYPTPTRSSRRSNPFTTPSTMFRRRLRVRPWRALWNFSSDDRRHTM